jgi:hypothetical protein
MFRSNLDGFQVSTKAYERVGSGYGAMETMTTMSALEQLNRMGLEIAILNVDKDGGLLV